MSSIKDDLETFENQCVLLRSLYLHHRVLFESSTAAEKDLMSRTANILFSDLNSMFIEYLILKVCALTEPTQSARKRASYCVSYFFELCGSQAETSWRLNQLHEQLLTFGKKLRPARNKFVAHSDRDAIIAGQNLGAASTEQWTEFWLNLQEFVFILHDKVIGGPPFYVNGVAILTDADGLLKALRHSDCFEKLLADSDPAISRKCADLALG